MDITITYEKEDWAKFQTILEKNIRQKIKTRWDNFFISLFIWAVIGATSMFIFKRFSNEFHWPTAIYVAAFAIIFIGIFIQYLYRAKNAYAPSDSGCFIGTHTFTITETSITSKGLGYQSSHEWSLVHTIQRQDGFIILFVDTANAFIFPEHKLNDPEAFYQHIKNYCAPLTNPAHNAT